MAKNTTIDYQLIAEITQRFEARYSQNYYLVRNWERLGTAVLNHVLCSFSERIPTNEEVVLAYRLAFVKQLSQIAMVQDYMMT